VAPALGEPASFLARRVQRMVATLPRRRWPGAALALIVAVGAMVGACETPRPVEPERGTGLVPSSDQVYAEAVVEQKPEMLSMPQPEYPPLLRTAGIEGEVVVQVVIDTMGGAEPNSLKIIRSPNPGFDQPVKSAVLRALFRPARVDGRAVRVLTRIPIRFTLRRSAVDTLDQVPTATDPDVRNADSPSLDSAQAVGKARRNLCGRPSALRDQTCLVLNYRQSDGRHVVVLERRPPAGNDRVVVRLSGDTQNVDLEAKQIAPPASGAAAFDRGAVFTESTVDEPPAFLSGPALVYGSRGANGVVLIETKRGRAGKTQIEHPSLLRTAGIQGRGVSLIETKRGRPRRTQIEHPSLLRTAGIQGRVVVRAIIDATGRAEPQSVQVIESAHPGSAHPGFDESVRRSVLGARFRPGRVGGRAVRVLIEVPINFRLSGNSGRPVPGGPSRDR
jgi:protein TonB